MPNPPCNRGPLSCTAHELSPFARISLILVNVLFALVSQGAAFADDRFVESSSSPGSFPIVSRDDVSPICVDPNDWPGVVRAANDLRDDIERVSGKKRAANNELRGHPIIIGTLGKSPLIDRLVSDGKIDATAIAGKWESYFLQVVQRPLPEVESALVIVGSDKRGTIYGIYELSEQMGVSPWYWWADVPTPHHDDIFVRPGKYVRGEPAVKYRGFFLNDEAPALGGWVREVYGEVAPNGNPPIPRGVANMNSKFYARVFELLLRLRANYLWPAMWNNAFNEDDPSNAKLADEYGIVMGTSHQEPMLRAQKEWDRRYRQRWNYYSDAETLQNFWREGITRNKNFESILTIGLRGANDTPMIPGGTPEQSAELLKKIIADQRQMISEAINPDPSKVPQLWCPYKEVLEYYDRLGLRFPDDVTILWPDDNWGNLRRVPTPDERKRGGGAGIYYHFDYVGGPRNYKWINTNPLPKVWEQMTQALENGADRIWIVNVGDLKPLELPISFFFKLAWEGRRMESDQVAQFTHDWAAQQFGPEHADEIARMLARYGKFAGRRKHELLDPTTFSLVHDHEADRVAAEFNDLADEAEKISRQLPENVRDANFELVLHPIKASAIVTKMYIAAAKNKLYAAQRRASANDMAEQVRSLFKADQDLSDYFNHDLANGKWPHMMDQTHIGYANWQQPNRNIIPPVAENQIPTDPALGVAIEGSDAAWPASSEEAALPRFDSLNDQRRSIEVFNQGATPFDFVAKASRPWIKTSTTEGKVEKDMTLWITIDWSLAPKGLANDTVTISGAGTTVSVQVNTINPEDVTRTSLTGFAEDAGFVSIEAEHYTQKTDTPGARWVKLDDFGRTLSAMTIFPMSAASANPSTESPSLKYQMYLFDSGPVEVQAIFSPTLAFLPGRPLRYAIAFDDQPPQTIDILPGRKNRDGLPADWEASVKDSVRVSKSKHSLAKKGYHTLSIWMVDPAVVLEKLLIDLGGSKSSYLGPPESFRSKDGTQ